jgi:uncharacterized membrane protein YhaH (DUF805 family)
MHPSRADLARLKKGEGMPYFGGIFGLVLLVLDIVAIVDCVQRSMDMGMKVLWIILIILLPIIGLLLYFLLGRKQTGG